MKYRKEWHAYVGISVHKLKVTHIIPQLPSFGRRIHVFLTIQNGSADGECQEMQAFLKRVRGEWKIDGLIGVEPGLESFGCVSFQLS